MAGAIIDLPDNELEPPYEKDRFCDSCNKVSVEDCWIVETKSGDYVLCDSCLHNLCYFDNDFIKSILCYKSRVPEEMVDIIIQALECRGGDNANSSR